MINRRVVQLSDGRRLVVEAEHLGEIRITVVSSQRPADAGFGWGSYEIRHRTNEEWAEQELWEKKEQELRSRRNS